MGRKGPRASDKIDFPDDKIDFPDDKIDFPDDKIDFPDDKIDFPDDRIDLPCDKIDFPDDKIDFPVDRIDLPCDGIDLPGNRIDLPGDRIDLPGNRIDLPGNRIDLPVDRIDLHDDKIDLPGNRIDLPGDRIDLHGDRIDLPDDEIDLPGDRIDLPDDEIDLHGDRIDLPGVRIDLLGVRIDLPVDRITMRRPPALSLACLVLSACSPIAPAPASPAEPAVGGEAPAQTNDARDVPTLETLLAATLRASPGRPLLLRRLAEAAIVEEAEAHGRAARETDPAARKRAQEEAHAAQAQAIASYTQLKDEYPAFCHTMPGSKGPGCIDEVLFYLAFELEQAGEVERARRTYQELIDAFPRSRYLPDAYLVLAERAFEDGVADPAKLAAAARAYEKVLSFPPADNPLAAYAQYKLAWVRRNDGDPGRAAEAFRKAIALGEQQGDKAAPLVREAKKDLAQVCADLAAKMAPLPAACAAAAGARGVAP